MGIYDHQNIHLILDLIDNHGVERLRTVGESINRQLYHIVMYEAFNEGLRVVYSQIIR